MSATASYKLTNNVNNYANCSDPSVRLSEVSSSNHLHTLCSFPRRPGTSSGGGRGIRPDPDFSFEEISVDVLSDPFFFTFYVVWIFKKTTILSKSIK